MSALSTQPTHNGAMGGNTVLQIGCGHGIPGVYALAQGVEPSGSVPWLPGSH